MEEKERREGKRYSGSQPECISRQTEEENGRERARFTDSVVMRKKAGEGEVEAWRERARGRERNLKNRQTKVMGVFLFPC